MSSPPLRAERPLIGERAAPADARDPLPPLATDGAEPPAPPPPRVKPKRRGSWFRRTLGFLTLLILLGVAVSGIAGYAMWRQAASDMPDHAWLADYQPPQMSRIYAADSRLMAELALERRVFVPIGAIPPSSK